MLLDRAEPIYRQIALHFEREIFEGRLKPGDKLPSTRDLAKSFDVNPETVQTSLKMLADRGLIERRRKCGSFVRRKASGKCIGIAVGREIFGSVDMVFFCLLFNRMTSLLEKAGWSLKVFVITRQLRFDQGFYEMERAISDGSVHAILEICTNGLVAEWLEKHCPIPRFICPLSIDYGDFLRRAFAHLLENGRSRPVFVYDQDHSSPAMIDSIISSLTKEFSLPQGSIRSVHSEPAQDWGYRTAQALFEGPRDFDSLIVMFDNTCRGILYYLLEKGVRIPQDIALLSHANKGVAIFSHIPLTLLEFDPDEFALDIIASIDAKLGGVPYQNEPAKPRLIVGLSCGEAPPPSMDAQRPASAQTARREGVVPAQGAAS